MSDDDPKYLLREAKASFESKDFKEALDLCRRVLHADPSSYGAQVVAGAAAEGLGHAAEAKKFLVSATKVDPSKPLAWQVQLISSAVA